MHPLVTTSIVSPLLLFSLYPRDVLCVESENMSKARGAREKLLITIYQEVNDLFRSNTRCDDENVRDGGNTDLPEQHFSLIRKIIKTTQAQTKNEGLTVFVEVI